MPHESLEFAKYAYSIINETIAKDATGGLAIAGEEHYDRPDPDHMEPALQAVYLHIGLLEVLRNRFGEDHVNKVKLGVELTERALHFITASIENASGEIPERLKNYPMVYAIQHAIKLGIEIEAVDTYADYNGELIGPSADKREDAIQQNIKEMGIKNPDGFTIIIRGANHLSNDRGISNERILETQGNIKAHPDQNPFKNSYRHVYYFNAAHPNSAQLTGDSIVEKVLTAESRYYTGTDVIQIHAAHAVPNLKQVEIVKDVEEAARLIESEISNKKTSSLSQNLIHAISGLTITDQHFILAHIHQQVQTCDSAHDRVRNS